MATFLEELQEHIRVFNRELLALEQQPEGDHVADSVKVLFRSAHSLKGAARSVQASRLEALCHRLEEMLAAIRDGRRALDREAFALLFAAVDEFADAGRELSSPHDKRAASRPPAAPAAAADKARAQPIAAPSAEAPRVAPRAPAVSAAQAAVAPEPSARATRADDPADADPATAVGAVREPARAVVTTLAAAGPAPSTAAGRDPASRPARPARTVASSKPIEERGAVRVPRRRLDALLSQSGELLVARSRFDARHAEVKALQETLATWRADWRLADQAYVRWSRRERGQGAHAELPPRVDRLLRAGNAQLTLLARELERLNLALAEDRRTLERAAGPLHDQIHKARLLPFAEACEPLFRAVRDLCADLGKEADLALQTGEIELDRSIIDGLRDPLLHLVRNALAHGIESPEQRTAADKPRRGTIEVQATVRGDAVEVCVGDDGRGLDLAAIRARALQHGRGAVQSEAELAGLIFEPGFSTQASVSALSGRGVGLDVVRSSVESMRGTVQVGFEPGKGTRFTLQLPLTLTTLRVLLVRAGGETFALPSSGVRAMTRAGAQNLGAVAGRDTLLLGEAPVPVASLAQTLGLGETTPPLRASDKLPLVVLAADQQQVAIAVDELIAEQDIVLKAFGPRIGRPRHFAGASVLASGQIALVLKPLEVARSALGRAPSRQWSEGLTQRAANTQKRLLLVDDSITTRTLEKSILESAGHLVTTAADGLIAWQILQEQGADLVVSDVEMPNMDGLTLTQTIRSSKRFKDLPVILLTALHSEQDRARGLELGADAYLLKTSFDQKQLLETIRQLL